ncbi:MAG: hypothetical protein HC828_12700 [Blastochloris sp.]|nr:hypothetical protein [Blastochloris sp.]
MPVETAGSARKFNWPAAIITAIPGCRRGAGALWHGTDAARAVRGYDQE